MSTKLNFTAINSGYYRVYVNGVEVSKHLQEREAVGVVFQ